jgi:ribosomal protein S16
VSELEPKDVANTALWRGFARRVEDLVGVVTAKGAPTGSDERAAGLRYVSRFLAAGLRVCLECDDPDHPTFGRMIENAMSWGLDNPDCNYSWARVRGDATYRIEGTRGSARHLEFQVNTGHMGDGHIPAFGGGEDAWRTVSFLSADDLAVDAEGGFSITLASERPEAGGNWLALDPDASHVLVRQYFDDWERERPAVFSIERIGARYPRPSLTAERLASHFETLHTWLDAGVHCWDRVSRLLLSLEPNTLLVFDVGDDVDRPGLHGQSYGMGPFACAPDEAVVLEFEVPPCRMWGAALTNFWWESLEFGQRQTSLNGHWARLDGDGIFRGVIAHEDPGVPNWLDTEGNERGTLAVRFLFADRTPKPTLRRLKLADLRDALPPDTPRLTQDERSAVIARRNRALQRRYGY